MSTASLVGRTPPSAREREQSVDDPREPVGFSEGRREIGLLFGVERVLEALETEAQRCKGSTELVRGVGKERPLSVDELLQTICHVIDSLTESGELGGAAPDRRPLRQAAGSDRGNGCLNGL